MTSKAFLKVGLTSIGPSKFVVAIGNNEKQLRDRLNSTYLILFSENKGQLISLELTKFVEQVVCASNPI
jgi:hypothetical protein